MRKILGLSLLTLVALTPLLVSVTLAKPESTWDTSHKHYVHGIAVEIEGETWYFEGPGSVRNLFDAIDVPGHKWVQMGPYRVKGLHYSLGPKGMGSWWATGEDSGVLLFVVDGRIAPWNEEISNKMAKKWYVHYRELVQVVAWNETTGMPIFEEHPTLVVWLKHTAVTDFYFDGGPMAPMSNHYVYKGVDFLFIPNYFKPYEPHAV